MTTSAHAAYLDTLRQQMVDAQLRARGIRDERVLAAMTRVPRHAFAPEPYRDQAYEDHPLPIAEGQTISQPYIVAVMLEYVAPLPGDRVLEVGTGSGYVTALLAGLAGMVISIERHASLANSARELLAGMGYPNASVVTGDGTQGFPQCAPYDAIIVSAAAPEVPRALLDQLSEGGRMVIPVGQYDSQQLQLIRMEGGQPRTILRDLCRFVPLISEGQA
ncbi:MAG TPA: protein-L-isoaspartate(D-aspartate) O-methyltransferase [Candidatus Dormibacteraeota bacterium]|nr:protein-L-isoaspartate(D-aspartate) O-methyltransferase [Candidatus Dormibacteraeota bacterium]